MNMRSRTAILLASCAFVAAGCTNEAGSTAELHVRAPGMHCDGCTSTVEETLAKMPGVDSVHADLASKDVYVRLDTAATSPAAIDAMIRRLGFAEAPAEGD